jgi:hypothetical protein
VPITPDHIRETLDDYLDAHPDEKWRLAAIPELLDASADLAFLLFTLWWRLSEAAEGLAAPMRGQCVAIGTERV